MDAESIFSHVKGDQPRARHRKNEIIQYEVVGSESDRDIIRSLVKRPAKGGGEADRVRTQIDEALDGKGGIVAALLRSPPVGADLDLPRDRVAPRDIEL